MTLIVGVLCQGGVVLGSDGAATLGNLSETTTRQPTRKLLSISDRVILGVSGPVGLSQLFEDRIKTLGNELAGTKTKTVADAMRKLSTAFQKDVTPAFRSAESAAPVIGQARASIQAISSSVVALVIQRQPTLIQLDQQCSAEAASRDLPFVAIGSAQRTADPFLALIRRVFWKDQLPSVADGAFAVTWTFHQAIETSPGGVAEPMQLMVLDKDGTRELSVAELDGHRQMVDGVEEYLGQYRYPSGLDAPPGPQAGL